MKILIASPRLPHPHGKADSMTVYRLVEYLSARHEICLVTFYDSESEAGHIKALEDLCAKVVPVRHRRAKAFINTALAIPTTTPLQNAYYADRTMQRVMKSVAKEFNPDLIYAHLIRMARYTENMTGCPKILAMQISQTLNYQRMVKSIESQFYKLLYSIELNKVGRYEPRIMAKFDSCLLISEHDKNAILGQENAKNVFYSPHGVDVEFYRRCSNEPRNSKSILFCGVLETPTNQDAVLHFYREIYPLIKRHVPEVQFEIVGRNPPASISDLANSDASVKVHGSVDDVRPYYERCGIGIAPIRIGAGLQNKLLIGMSMEQAMVATSIANEGIQAVDGKTLIVADTPEDFAESVVHLLRHSDEAEQIGRQAREFVENKWTWEYYFSELEHHMIELSSARTCFTNVASCS